MICGGFSSVRDAEHHNLHLGRNVLARISWAEWEGRGHLGGGREKEEPQALSAEKSVLWNSRSQPAIGFSNVWLKLVSQPVPSVSWGLAWRREHFPPKGLG